MDETKKRKDTTVSLSNFFHRLTRGGTNAEDKKEDKNKSPIAGEEKEEDKVTFIHSTLLLSRFTYRIQSQYQIVLKFFLLFQFCNVLK